MSKRAPVVSSRYEDRRLRLIASEVRGPRVLDLGHAHLPNRYLDGPSVTGLDLEDPRSPSGYARDLRGSVMDLGNQFPDERFATVIAAELIEHLEQPYDFLRQVRAVLDADGRLVLSTPNPVAFPTIFCELVRSKRWFYARDHTYYFPPRWVERMLDDAGFRLLRIRPVGLWLPWGHVPWCPTAMSYQLIYVAVPSP